MGVFILQSSVLVLKLKQKSHSSVTVAPSRQFSPTAPVLTGLLATLLARFPLPSASKWEGWGWALSDSPSHICSLNLAHTCVRNPFLKLSSSELFGSKFYFLLYL